MRVWLFYFLRKAKGEWISKVKPILTVQVDSFRQQMADHNLDPGEIIPDATIHRFPTWGNSVGEASGSYWHNGNFGWFQDWRTMEKPEVVIRLILTIIISKDRAKDLSLWR